MLPPLSLAKCGSFPTSHIETIAIATPARRRATHSLPSPRWMSPCRNTTRCGNSCKRGKADMSDTRPSIIGISTHSLLWSWSISPEWLWPSCAKEAV